MSSMRHRQMMHPASRIETLGQEALCIVDLVPCRVDVLARVNSELLVAAGEMFVHIGLSLGRKKFVFAFLLGQNGAVDLAPVRGKPFAAGAACSPHPKHGGLDARLGSN